MSKEPPFLGGFLVSKEIGSLVELVVDDEPISSGKPVS